VMNFIMDFSEVAFKSSRRLCLILTKPIHKKNKKKTKTTTLAFRLFRFVSLS
jgi:hypothetical protein